MEGTKLIHQFFDEGISAAEEDSLFQALAGDQILRQEFLEHMKISSFIRHDISVTTPPSELTHAVFTGIGLPTPVEFQAASASGAGKRKSGGFLRFLPLVMTVLITATLTSGVFYLSADSDGRTGTSNASLMTGSRMMEPNNLAANTAALSTDAESGPSGVMDSRDMEVVAEATPITSTATAEARNVQAIVRVVCALTDVLDNAPPVTAATIAETPLLAMLRPENLHEMDVPLASVQENDTQLAPVRETLPEYGILGMPEGQTPFTIANLIVQFRMIGATSSNISNGLPTPTEGLFKNMALSGLYKLSENHALGFSYGREPIPRIYDRTIAVKESGTVIVDNPPTVMKSVEHRDYNMLDWGGVVWKMSHTNISLLNTFYPYTEMFAGATKYGPLGRVMLGIEMYPSNNSMINVGIEFSSLTYQIEESWYSTNKIGGSFGIAMSF